MDSPNAKSTAPFVQITRAVAGAETAQIRFRVGQFRTLALLRVHDARDQSEQRVQIFGQIQPTDPHCIGTDEITRRTGIPRHRYDKEMDVKTAYQGFEHESRAHRQAIAVALWHD